MLDGRLLETVRTPSAAKSARTFGSVAGDNLAAHLVYSQLSYSFLHLSTAAYGLQRVLLKCRHVLKIA